MESSLKQPREVALESSWKKVLADEFKQPYMQELRAFLQQQKQLGKIIYPKSSEIFNAFNHTPFEQVKVVILGQDPYHGPGQAHGLCFSVQHGVKPPPSLVNIFKELNADLQIQPAKHGCLTSWADQGVLLLNSVLTVEKGIAGSHQNKGWERFTDHVISCLNQISSRRIIFVLWGSYAHAKGEIIDTKQHYVLRAAHPSPFSAHRGFLGCKHFSQINNLLVNQGLEPIDWRLPE